MARIVPLRQTPSAADSACAIAVVAATAGLWLSAKVQTIGAGIAATLIMGIAVSGMHYTGMSAMRAEVVRGTIVTPDVGVYVAALLGPLIIGITVSTILLLLVIGLAPSAEEIKAQEKFRGWQARLEEL